MSLEKVFYFILFIFQKNPKINFFLRYIYYPLLWSQLEQYWFIFIFYFYIGVLLLKSEGIYVQRYFTYTIWFDLHITLKIDLLIDFSKKKEFMMAKLCMHIVEKKENMR